MRTAIALLSLFICYSAKSSDIKNDVLKQIKKIHTTAKTAGEVKSKNCKPPLKGAPNKINSGYVRGQFGEKIKISVLSKRYAFDLFKEISNLKHIPFRYPEDGCYARAHEISHFLEKKGIISGKIFIEGDLKVKTKNSPKGYAQWHFHVASTIKVKEGNKEVTYVFDPSLFNKPVTIDEWFSIQTNHPPSKSRFKKPKKVSINHFKKRVHLNSQNKKNLKISEMKPFAHNKISSVKAYNSSKRYNAGKFYTLYQTSRFRYRPNDENKEPKRYNPSHLQEAKAMLKLHLEVQRKREIQK